MDGNCAVDWSLVAPQWDRLRGHVERMKAALTPRLVAGLGLRAGQRVLELGAGTGELAAMLATAVAPGGTVLASDQAPGMVGLLKGRLDALPGVEVAEIDACDIPLADESVDAVAFRMGLMLISRPAEALSQIHRVLRGGGRTAIAVWGAPQDNPWLTAVGMAAMMHGVVQGGPPIGPGAPFSLSDPALLRQLLEAAGFVDVQVEQVDGVATFADVDSYVDTVRALAPPLSAALGAASDEALAQVRATVAGAVERFRTADGLTVPARALLATAGRA